MMSTVRVNTITDTASGNAMTVSDLNQGRPSARMWLNGTGTIAVLDGFGISSVTDNGAGDYSPVFSAAFSNALYCGMVTGDTTAAGFIGATRDGAGVRTAASIRCVIYSSGIAATDGYLQAAFIGDRP
jgi:hypothetical protein